MIHVIIQLPIFMAVWSGRDVTTTQISDEQVAGQAFGLEL